MDTKLALRMEVLADNTLSVVFERNRLKELKLNYDKYETNIQNNMTQLREGLGVLEQQLSTAEESGEANTTEDEDKLIKLQIKVDKLDALMGEKDDQTAREVLLGNARKPARFAAVDVDPEDLEDGQILQLQQRIMDEQDQNLDTLSDAIRRQRELGIMIGDELDTHAELIDETEAMVDRTDRKLQQARRKLNHVGRKVKDNKSVCIVIALILVFFVLVALVK